jgi:hypothetical protein
MPQAVLTVVPGVQFDMAEAGGLATVMKQQDRIFDWRPAIPPRGISVILKDGTAPGERLAIANEFKALRYNVIEVP